MVCENHINEMLINLERSYLRGMAWEGTHLKEIKMKITNLKKKINNSFDLSPLFLRGALL